MKNEQRIMNRERAMALVGMKIRQLARKKAQNNPCGQILLCVFNIENQLIIIN